MSTKDNPSLYAAYAKSVVNFRDLECSILRLMRDPETTNKQMEIVRQKYVDLFKRMTHAHQLLTDPEKNPLRRHAARPSLTAYHDRDHEERN